MINNNNNIFEYATKELSQDAMLCWLINWINFENHPLQRLGEEILNLFTGNNKDFEYKNVNIDKQFKKIDILVLFNDKNGQEYALIVEDKTNSTEHDDQINRYNQIIASKYPNRHILLSYVKTGIMYDEDYRIIGKTDTVISINELLSVINHYDYPSQILSDYKDYLQSIVNERKKIDNCILTREYNDALSTEYGQYSFFNRIFNNRSKGTELGDKYKMVPSNKQQEKIYIDSIYAGTNNGGEPWTQYCFWGEKFDKQLTKKDINEFQYLFWRVDCKWRTINNNTENEKSEKYFYIALRHYDENTKFNDETKLRKHTQYNKFRKICEYIENDSDGIFTKFKKCDNYNESDLLYTTVDILSDKDFDQISSLLINATSEIIKNLSKSTT